MKLMQVIEAALVYFALVFGLGFVLGAIRVPCIVPHLGVRRAELLEMPLMLVGMVLAAQCVVKRYGMLNTIFSAVSVGLLALSLMIMAETLLIVLLQGGNIWQYIKQRDRVSGSVYIVLLMLFALMPLLIMHHSFSKN